MLLVTVQAIEDSLLGFIIQSIIDNQIRSIVVKLSIQVAKDVTEGTELVLVSAGREPVFSLSDTKLVNIQINFATIRLSGRGVLPGLVVNNHLNVVLTDDTTNGISTGK